MWTPPVQCGPGVKWPGLQTDHSPQSNAVTENEWRFGHHNLSPLCWLQKVNVFALLFAVYWARTETDQVRVMHGNLNLMGGGPRAAARDEPVWNCMTWVDCSVPRPRCHYRCQPYWHYDDRASAGLSWRVGSQGFARHCWGLVCRLQRLNRYLWRECLCPDVTVKWQSTR